MSKKEDLEKEKKLKKLKEAEKAATTTAKRTANLISDEERDAAMEKSVGEKYKDVSPVMSKGVFTVNSPKNAENTGITQDDVDRIKRKKK